MTDMGAHFFVFFSYYFAFKPSLFRIVNFGVSLPHTHFFRIFLTDYFTSQTFVLSQNTFHYSFHPNLIFWYFSFLLFYVINLPYFINYINRWPSSTSLSASVPFLPDDHSLLRFFVFSLFLVPHFLFLPRLITFSLSTFPLGSPFPFLKDLQTYTLILRAWTKISSVCVH